MRKYTPFSSVETSIVAAFSALKSYSPTVLPDMSTNLTVPIAFSLLSIRMKSVAGFGYTQMLPVVMPLMPPTVVVALTAMHLIGEVGCDVARFPNERAFASFLGLVPTSHDSGERKSQGTKTFRCNKALCSLMVEASWKAVVHDAEFCAYYGRQREASAEGDNQSGKEIVQQNIQANEIDKNMTCGQCHTGNGCFFRRGRLLFTI